ncbi:MAG: isocitrate lyase/phosphoenolpyruvate mutase family protein [Parvibaculum sp.]|nr:isocitrate lyase/phosphoenolpyruvate mutase family protein [Parvibaculum sp.]
MDKATQKARAEAFAALHRKGDPVKLFNIWDAISAQAVTKAGATALATSSYAVANAHGTTDKENLSRDLLITSVREITSTVDLPVSVDAESGYGHAPAIVGETVSLIIAAGGIGMNFEDQVIGGEGIFPVETQSARIAGARAAADKAGIPFFINARTDIFLRAKRETHDAAMVDQAIERGLAYAKAGASGFFIPGLLDPALIEKVCKAVALPVNIMAHPAAPSAAELAKYGVARISLGAWPMFDMLARLEATAKDYFATGVARAS